MLIQVLIQLSILRGGDLLLSKVFFVILRLAIAFIATLINPPDLTIADLESFNFIELDENRFKWHVVLIVVFLAFEICLISQVSMLHDDSRIYLFPNSCIDYQLIYPPAHMIGYDYINDPPYR